MNKSVKKLNIIICSLAICTGTYFNTFIASAKTVTIPSKEKLDTTTKVYNMYKKNINKNMTNEQLKARQQEIDEELTRLTANNTPIESIEKIMSGKNVYMVQDSTNSTNTMTLMSSANSDVTLNKPSIWYDSAADQWAVTGGGSWNNTNWKYDAPALVGNGWYNVGKNDTVGISIHDTYGDYTGTSCVSGYAYVTDHNGRSSSAYTNPSSNDFSHGVYFTFQDQAYWDPSGGSNGYGAFTKYYGDGFACTVRYSSNFRNYHGNMTTFYGHTWSSVDVSSVSFGTSGTVPGATINFTGTTNRWPAYTFDTSF